MALPILTTSFSSFKGIVYLKISILSSSTYPHFDFYSSVEQKLKILSSILAFLGSSDVQFVNELLF